MMSQATNGVLYAHAFQSEEGYQVIEQKLNELEQVMWIDYIS